MKKIILAGLIAAAPLFAQATNISINVDNARIQTPGVTVTFGNRDNRGYYWDGYDWRTPKYWKRHHGPRGEKYYTGHRSKGVPSQHKRDFCPPGQAKKGRCRVSADCIPRR